MAATTYSMHIHGLALIPFFIVYFVPTAVAAFRKGRFMVPAIIVDVLLAWTVIGWIVALALAIPGRTASSIDTRAVSHA